MTAVDTNIILDVLIPGEPFGDTSKKLLDRHLSKVKLISTTSRYLDRYERTYGDIPVCRV